MKRINELMLKATLFSMILVLLGACGGKPENSAEATSTTPVVAENGVVKITVNSDDLMRFDKKEIRAVAGAKVELTLNHTGKLAKEAMGHNLVILKQGTDIASFAQKAIDAKENDYIPEGEDVIVYTELIGGGESTTVTFESPVKGTYDFLCSFPGHWGLMQGKFIVE